MSLYLSVVMLSSIKVSSYQSYIFTFREPLPNKRQQQNQRKAKQTIHVEKYIEFNFKKILYKALADM